MQKKAEKTGGISKKGLAMLLGLTLTAGASIGVAIAYYSGQAPLVTNRFTLDGGAANQVNGGTITEDNWDNITQNPDNGGDKDGDGILDIDQAQPGQTFLKDPKLTNGQNYNAYAYLRIKVPVLSAKLGDETTASVHDALTYNIDTANWELVDSASSVSTTVGTPSVYIYRYIGKTDPSDTKLANKVVGSGKTTQTLFNEITFQNFKEVSDNFSGAIDIHGALVQTDGFNDNSSLAEALEIFQSMDGGTYDGGNQS